MGQPIRRVLYHRSVAGCGDGSHPSTNAVADALQRPTRALGRAALDHALSGLAPGGVYLAPLVTQGTGGLLHRRFTLTRTPKGAGGLFSVALSCGLPRVGVTHHPALRSPDVPRATCVARGRLAVPSIAQSTGSPRRAGRGSQAAPGEPAERALQLGSPRRAGLAIR